MNADTELFSPAVLDISDTALRRQIDELAAVLQEQKYVLDDLAAAATDDPNARTELQSTVDQFEYETYINRIELQRILIGLFSFSGTCLRGLPHLTYALGLATLPDVLKRLLVVPWVSSCLQNAHVAKQLLTEEKASPILQWIGARGGPLLPATVALELLEEDMFSLMPLPLQAASKETIAATVDDSLVWMLQRLFPAVGADQTGKQVAAVARLRSWLVAGTHDEISFGGKVMPMTKTKQFLAPYFRVLNLKQLQQLAREQGAARCTEMQQPNNPRCKNEEGTLGGTSWCDTAAWAYFRDVDGYCYDIRELLTQLSQNDPLLPEPQPTYAFTRRPIEPTDIYNWAVKATEREWTVPVNIARMLAAYTLSGPAANVARPYGRYAQLTEQYPWLEQDVLDMRTRGEFFNPSMPLGYIYHYPPAPSQQELEAVAELDELPEGSPVLTRGVQQVVYRGPPSTTTPPGPSPPIGYHRRRRASRVHNHPQRHV